jgi:hypothetical protein
MNTGFNGKWNEGDCFGAAHNRKIAVLSDTEAYRPVFF